MTRGYNESWFLSATALSVGKAVSSSPLALLLYARGGTIIRNAAVCLLRAELLSAG